MLDWKIRTPDAENRRASMGEAYIWPGRRGRSLVEHAHGLRVDEVMCELIKAQRQNGEVQAGGILDFMKVTYPGTNGDLHTDVMSAKGAILDCQSLFVTDEGKDPWMALAEKIHERQGTPPAGTDASVAVSYDFLASKKFEVTVDYRAA